MLSLTIKSAALIAVIIFSVNPADANLRRRDVQTTDKLEGIVGTNTTNAGLNLTSRIIGGSQAQRGAFPYFTQWVWGCGAVLIHEDIVLTAAHCNVLTSNKVIIGAYQDETTGNGAVTRTITKRALHPLWNPSTMENDFLILKLSSKVTNKPVSLNRVASNPASGDDLVVMGFGRLTAGGGSYPTFLQKVTIKAVSHATCNSQFGGTVYSGSMLCAGVSAGGKDSCGGDSGGPLVKIVNGVHTLVGIVSWGASCAEPNWPGVYARVSGRIAWIDQKICALSANPPARCRTLKTTTSEVITSKSTANPDKKINSKVVTKPPTSSREK